MEIINQNPNNLGLSNIIELKFNYEEKKFMKILEKEINENSKKNFMKIKF